MISRFALGLVIGSVFWISVGQTAPLCPQPQKGLRSSDTNTHGEVLSFSYQSNSYPIDLFSAYARRVANGLDYCLRYEAINKGAAVVERFFWPLASNLDIKSFAPQARPSIVITAKSENPPAIVATKVYAFAREQISSRAYKAESQPTNEAAVGSTKNSEYAQGWFERITLKEPTDFPEIGAQFADEKTEVTSLSGAKWDGGRLTISIMVGASDGNLISNLRAPVAYALAKGITNERAFYAAARQLKSSPLPLANNQFAFAPTLVLREAELFVIRSPIAFDGPAGRVCFVATAYSPVPSPSEALNCDSLE